MIETPKVKSNVQEAGENRPHSKFSERTGVCVHSNLKPHVLLNQRVSGKICRRHIRQSWLGVWDHANCEKTHSPTRNRIPIRIDWQHPYHHFAGHHRRTAIVGGRIAAILAWHRAIAARAVTTLGFGRTCDCNRRDRNQCQCYDNSRHNSRSLTSTQSVHLVESSGKELV